MKNFLKLTAIFACLALVFVACNEDDTVDGYVPNFPAIDAENVTVTRGDGKIKVVWTVPDEESITYSRISWYGADKGSEIVPVTYGAETTFTIGVDDEAGESGSPLPAGEYTIKIESMEGKYVGTGSWSSTDRYAVYNAKTYEGQYPVVNSIEHDNADATITWGSFPDDCISVDINYYKEGEDRVVLTVVPAEALEAVTTLLPGAVIDSKVTFTPTFRPEDAIQEDSEKITIAESPEHEITISDAVKAQPKIQSALGGVMKLYVEWTVYQDINISASTVQVYEGDAPFGDPFVIDYANFDSASPVYGYTAETANNTDVKNVYLNITNTELKSAYFVAGTNYTVQITNTIAAESTPAISDNLYVYDSSIYGECPKITEITHDGSNAVIVWNLSDMTGYGAEDVNSSYNALSKIEVTYNTDKVITFTSEDTNHFSFECNLPDAKYDTNDATFSYKAYFRPVGAIEADEHYVTVDAPNAEVIPYPELAAPVGVELRSGYNADKSSYIEAKWFDVDGVLGVANDAVVDVLVFYTDDYTKLDALAAAIDSEKVLTGVSGADYSQADWSSIDWDYTTLPTPLSVVGLLGTTPAEFIANETIVNGATVTIGKTGDTSGVSGLPVNKTYYVAMASINAAGKLNFKNLNNGDTVESLAEEWGVDLTTISYDDYIQRLIKTYNAETYTSNVENQKVFNSETATAITRKRTSATVAWDWSAATEADVVAVKVTEYTNNEDGKTNPTVETSKGSTTALTYVKAGTGNLSGYTAYFCPAALSGDVCGIERVEIVQTLPLDMPYLAVPGYEMTMMVGVNEGTSSNSTVETGEPYIKSSWILANEDANVENISGYKLMYRTGTDEFVASEGDFASSLREAIIAPATPLAADVDYDVYISYVDLDGYTRPLAQYGDAADGSTGAANIHTYNKLTYQDKELPLNGTIEEIAYDGETMTLYWGDMPTDCVGVIVTMTSGRREGQSYGYEYVLGETTEVVDVDWTDKFTYTPYFRPTDVGEVIVAGKTSTKGCYTGPDGTSPVKDLSVPVSTAPTRAEITNITSSYVGESGSETPQITIEWDFPSTALNRENILTETGTKYMYIYCYEDGMENYTYINRMVITDDTEYSYTLSSDKLSVDKKYTIYVATKNINSVFYKSDVFAGIKTYTPSSYDVSLVPAITSAVTNTSNDVEVEWSTETMSEDVRNIYIIYNNETSEPFTPSLGSGSVSYKKGASMVALKADFKPSYEEEADTDDPDYVAPEPVVFYGEAVSFTSAQTEAQTFDYDIALDGGVYTIFTAKGLAAFADLVNGTSYYTGIVNTQGTITSWDQDDGLVADAKLVDNIDLADLDTGSDRTNWIPIGDWHDTKTNIFKGSFDGNGYTISNLYINKENVQSQGLFGYISASTIQNVKLENISVSLGGSLCLFSGALVGIADASSLISNCEVASGNFDINNSIGAHAGIILGRLSQGTTVENCINRANGTSNFQQFAAIVGNMMHTTNTNRVTTGYIRNCTNYGNITSTATFTAGIVGYFFISNTDSVVENCYNYGEITGGGNTGGIVGAMRSTTATSVATVSNCHNYGTISGTGTYFGGVVGQASTNSGANTITNCSNSAPVTGTGNYVGGICGGDTAGKNVLTLTTSSNSGDITGAANVGGIIGWVQANSSVSGQSLDYPSKNTGSVKGTSNVGAIVGQLEANATLSYYNHYTGTVTGTAEATTGGLVGLLNGEMIDCIDKTDPANADAGAEDIRLVNGTWEIYTAKGLAAFADVVNGTSKFLLADKNPAANGWVRANIDMSEMADTYAWAPIELYAGTFNGGNSNGYSIKNLSIEASTDYQGLFATTEGATIKNVSLENFEIESTAGYVGAIVGYATKGTTVQDCHLLSGEISADGDYVGSIVGYNYGGEAGAYGSVVSGCTNVVKISGASYVGGIVGYNYPDSSTTPCKVMNCSNSGEIKASSDYVGGVVGYNRAPETKVITESAIVTECTNSGVLDIKSSNVGGIVGANAYDGAKVDASSNSGAIYGASRVAGIAGSNSNGAIVNKCENGGVIKATGSYIAGIVGQNDEKSTVQYCNNLSSGTVFGVETDSYVSGITGEKELVGICIYNNNSAGVSTNVAPDPDLELDGGIYKIWTGEGLVAFADLVNGNVNSTSAIVIGDGVPEFGTLNPTLSAKVVANLDLDDLTYIPAAEYEGTFDGGSAEGYTISNLTSVGTATYHGLFSSTIAAKISNVKLNKLSMTSSGSYVGGIVGHAKSQTTITNCEITSGLVKGTTNVGGIVGYNAASVVDGCTNGADVEGSGNVGGLAGASRDEDVAIAYVKNSKNTGDVSCSGAISGGIVGSNYASGHTYAVVVENCINEGDVSGGTGQTGGIVGTNRGDAQDKETETLVGVKVTNADVDGIAFSAVIMDCTNTGNISDQGGNVGGIVGYFLNNNIVTRSKNSGKIVGASSTGGIVGQNRTNGYYGYVTYCDNSGDVETISTTVGGIVGYNYGTLSVVSYCNNSGNVTVPSTSTSASANAGGIVGNNTNGENSAVNYCNNTGNVTSNFGANAGGIIGLAGGSNITVKGDSSSKNYNEGTVSGTTNVGGLVGSNAAIVTNYVNKGRVVAGGIESNEMYGLVGAGTAAGSGCEDQYVSTQSETYEISNETELLAFVTAAAADPAVNANLTASFSLSGLWTPIANYSGTFNGAGFTISGVTISGATANQGFFGTTVGATIKDLTISGVQISSSAGYVGGLVGNATASTVITDCHVMEGSVSGTTNVGGLVGYINSSTIENSSSSIAVSASGDYAGGIAGYVYGEATAKGLVDNCANSGEVTGASCVGGITGRNHLTSTVSNSTNEGVVTGTSSRTGGIVGHNCPNASNADTFVIECTNRGEVYGVTSVGGVVGENQNNSNPAYIQTSSNYGAVTGSGANIGGIVGNNTSTSVIAGTSSNYGVNYGAVTGTSAETTVGGIVGAANDAQISYYTNYALVTVNGVESNVTNGVYGTAGSNVLTLLCTDAYVDLETTNLDIMLVGSTYSIYSAKGLAAFAEIVNGTLSSVDGLESNGTVSAVKDAVTGANATLEKAIDMTDVSWTPIADYSTNTVLQYTGKFNGNGNAISNLQIDSTSPYQGLFGYASGATISGVLLENISMTLNGTVDQYSGAVVGRAVGATITDCEVSSGTITTETTSTNSYVGGIVGFIATTTIEDCINRADVTGTANSVAGIVGACTSSEIEITGCYNYGNITGSALYVSGIAGFLQATSSSRISDCHNEGVITGGEKGNVAGVVAYLRSMTASGRVFIIGCTNKGVIESAGPYTGGVAGFMAPNGGAITVTGGYNYGSVTGTSQTGGVVAGQGNATADLFIIASNNSGDIVGTTYVGGITGQITNEASIIGTAAGGSWGCKNTGSVTGTKAADATEASITGGIVGSVTAGIVYSCTNSGLVTVDGVASNSTNGIYGANSGTVSDECVDNYVAQ